MIRYYFDTSVVVAASSLQHPHYHFAIPWLESLTAGGLQGVISCHVIAEYFSTMTNLKSSFSVEPDFLEATLETRMQSNFKIVTIPPPLYFAATKRCATRSARNGKIYDALHLEAALAAKCDALLTLNFSDFARLAEGENLKIVDASKKRP